MEVEVARLVESLRHSDIEVRRRAAEQLAQRGEQARPAVPALLEALADEDEAVREWSVAALEALGPPSRNDREGLRRGLADTRGDIAYWAATLLGRLEEQAVAAVEDLLRTSQQHPQQAARERAVWALGMIGPAARPAIPALEQHAAGDAPRLARLAQHALVQIRR